MALRIKKEELIETENDKDDHKENFIQNLPQALPTKFQLIWPMTNKKCLWQPCKLCTNIWME
jgi:hypothetical protein